MTKSTAKTKAAAKESTAAAPLIVLGYDEHHKPQGGAIPGRRCRPGCQGRPADGPQGL